MNNRGSHLLCEVEKIRRFGILRGNYSQGGRKGRGRANRFFLELASSGFKWINYQQKVDSLKLPSNVRRKHHRGLLGRGGEA